MSDAWEALFGLDRRDVRDRHLDADGDGLTNEQEYTAGTHPRGMMRRYLAEGVSSPFFATSLALANATNVPAVVLLRFLQTDGNVRFSVVNVDGISRPTIDPAAVPGLDGTAYSVVIESDVPVVAALSRGTPRATAVMQRRASTVPRAPGTSRRAPRTRASSSSTLVQNPNPTPVSVSVTYLRPAPAAPLTKQYEVAAYKPFQRLGERGSGIRSVPGWAQSDHPALSLEPRGCVEGRQRSESSRSVGAISNPGPYWPSGNLNPRCPGMQPTAPALRLQTSRRWPGTPGQSRRGGRTGVPSHPARSGRPSRCPFPSGAITPSPEQTGHDPDPMQPGHSARNPPRQQAQFPAGDRRRGRGSNVQRPVELARGRG